MALEYFSGFSTSMHTISQSLLYPVLIVLAIFFIYSLITVGMMLAEYYKRRKLHLDLKNVAGLILSLTRENISNEITTVLNNVQISESHKQVLVALSQTKNVDPAFRESLALKMMEDETIMVAKKLEKTDIIAKISPAVGLMGTLIPLGPGLTALGAGDIQLLADHLMTAFDAAVLGMAAAAIAFTISKIRRRWYEEDISNLETLAESVLEVLKS
ncbi:MotA/TolQ/ExbB proton channel family protein [Methanobacterium sp. CWC-01]|uniref:MotA/TolQ/ExbB proton channel family protein n=1 Tax=Methanobacterium aridiramus TaxID=2584467 RepID=UPI002574B1AD|nr:MotA/TolQ/ExbB proton channel family protein [Methanobacterium sp. CWC-01]WJI09384.1 MotA/TolQ/ExbB proton channel family protein [Methanobacterium sp. CWC-01]